MKNVQSTNTAIAMRLLILLSLINSLSANFCNLSVRLLQELQNKGFHRNLTYKVIFHNTNQMSYKDCYVGLDQELPPGVFTSPDELRDLLRMNKVSAIPKNRVNVELPAEESQPSGVFIVGSAKAGEARFWLPVHARYHRAAKGGGFYFNEIKPPGVYIRCPDRRLDDCEPEMPQASFPCTAHGKDTCAWKEVPVTLLSPAMLGFPMPVGDLDHYDTVASATAAVVVVFSLYLLKTLHEYNLAIKRK